MDNIDFATLLKDLKFHKSCISQKKMQSIAQHTLDFLSSHIQNLVGFFGGVGRIKLENIYRQINILLGLFK